MRKTAAKKKLPRRRPIRGGAEPFPEPDPMELGPALPSREKERIVTGTTRRRREQQQMEPPVPLRPGPPPRADAPPPPAPPQIPEGVEIIRREMDALIKEISEGVRRTAGDVSESDRLTEINDRLVSFVQGVMEALSRLLEHLEAYNKQMTEVTQQLRTFGTQVGKSSGKTDKAAKDAVARLEEFKGMVSKTLEGMKKHLRQEDLVPLQKALGNWNELTKLATTKGT